MDLRDVLSEQDIDALRTSNNWAGARIIAFDWSMIIGTFWITAQFPNPLTIALAVILLGRRQLALGIIVHETCHRSLFTDQPVNDFCGNWLAGYWVFSDKDAYMQNHLKHHQFAGTPDDPDLPNYNDYPVSTLSLKRKITRDLTGQVGWRRMSSIARSIARLPRLKPNIRQTVIRSLALNLTMLLVMSALGVPWLFLLWVTAFMTSHMLVTRIRQIAEHAAVPDHFNIDVRFNTRTIYISPLERLLIAPHQISFHLEHHLMASVPIYNLRRLHELLLSKGFYKGVTFSRGYLNLLRQTAITNPHS